MIFKATIKFKGVLDIEYEAMGEPEAGEKAAEIFEDMDKGEFDNRTADIEITDLYTSRMSNQEINERKYDTDERV